MLNPLFKIQPQSENNQPSSLFIEVGENSIAAAVLNNDSNFFTDILVYNINDNLPEIIDAEDIFKNKYQQVFIFYNYEECVLTPPQFYKREQNAQMLDLMFGDKVNRIVTNDFIPKLNMYNVYRVPLNCEHLLRAKFEKASFYHSWSLLSACKMANEDFAYVVFYEKKYTVVLYKNGVLVFVKCIGFNTPEDAAYHLLNACAINAIDVAKCNLILSGLIEEKSVLYAALHNYFLNIKLDSLSDKYSYSDEIMDYPQHFFSHLFLMASCV